MATLQITVQEAISLSVLLEDRLETVAERIAKYSPELESGLLPYYQAELEELETLFANVNATYGLIDTRKKAN